MSFKRSNRRDTQGQGKTGWEHLTDWVSGSSDTSDESLNDPNVILRGRFNPLHLKLGEMVELSLHTQKTAYEVDGIICFEPLGRGERATRYEFKDTSPPLILEGLEASEGVLYTLYELADEFKLDPQLLKICRSEDRLEHEIETEGESGNIQYIKDAEARSKAPLESYFLGLELLGAFTPFIISIPTPT